jgi:hypothetical protein
MYGASSVLGGWRTEPKFASAAWLRPVVASQLEVERVGRAKQPNFDDSSSVLPAACASRLRARRRNAARSLVRTTLLVYVARCFRVAEFLANA